MSDSSLSTRLVPPPARPVPPPPATSARRPDLATAAGSTRGTGPPPPQASSAAAGLGRHGRAPPAGASSRGRAPPPPPASAATDALRPRARAAAGDEDGRRGSEAIRRRVARQEAAGGAAGGGGRRVLTERTEEARTGVGSLRPPFSEGRGEPASGGNILIRSQPNPLLFHPNNRGDGSAPTWPVPLFNQTYGKGWLVPPPLICITKILETKKREGERPRPAGFPSRRLQVTKIFLRFTNRLCCNYFC